MAVQAPIVFHDEQDLLQTAYNLGLLVRNLIREDSEHGPCLLDRKIALAGKPITVFFFRDKSGHENASDFQMYLSDRRMVGQERKWRGSFGAAWASYELYIDTLDDDESDLKPQISGQKPEGYTLVQYSQVMMQMLEPLLKACGRPCEVKLKEIPKAPAGQDQIFFTITPLSVPAPALVA